MKITYTYYQNPSTKEVVMRQCFTEKGKPDDVYFYNAKEKSIEPPDLTGWEEITEKRFYDIAYAGRNL